MSPEILEVARVALFRDGLVCQKNAVDPEGSDKGWCDCESGFWRSRDPVNRTREHPGGVEEAGWALERVEIGPAALRARSRPRRRRSCPGSSSPPTPDRLSSRSIPSR